MEQFTIQPQEEKEPIVVVPTPKEEVIVTTDNMESPFNWQSVMASGTESLWKIWLLVALVILVRKITVYQSFVKYVRAGSRRVGDIELLEQLGKIVEKEKAKVAIELSTNNLISSPILIGFFRPCIVLPTAQIESSDFSKIMLHEIMHYNILVTVLRSTKIKEKF